MKNETIFAKKFAALVKKIRSEVEAPQVTIPSDPVTQLVLAFLEWNASRKLAAEAYDRLMSQLVDNNDLRVSHQAEIINILGPKYPQAEERIARMHESLQEVYVREHSMNINHLTDKPKKLVRQYFDTLPGVLQFASAYVTLACYQGHAFPVDDRTLELLKLDGGIDPSATNEETEAFLGRHIKSEQTFETFLVIQAWSESNGQRLAQALAKAAKENEKADRLARAEAEKAEKAERERAEKAAAEAEEAEERAKIEKAEKAEKAKEAAREKAEKAKQAIADKKAAVKQAIADKKDAAKKAAEEKKEAQKKIADEKKESQKKIAAEKKKAADEKKKAADAAKKAAAKKPAKPAKKSKPSKPAKKPASKPAKKKK